MSRQLRNAAAGLTAVLAISSVLAACSTDSANESQSPQPEEPEISGNAAEQTHDGKYDPPITVTMVRDMPGSLTFPPGDSLDSNVMTKLLEETYGIKVVNQWVTDGSAYYDKLNLSIASGDLPDIFRVSPTQLKQLTDAGMIADLTDVYEKNIAPLTDELLRTDNGVGLASATLDGKLMGLPYVNAATEGSQMIWLRKDWLDQLGLPEPKTMEDVFRISKAFTFDDPDQNGQDDTFGFGFHSSIFGGFGGMTGFFNSYHAYKDTWIQDPAGGGGLVQGNIQPEMKQALAVLQELYKSGEIDREFSVKTAEQLLQDITAGKVGMFFGGFAEPLNKLNRAVTNDPNQVWEMYPLPSIDGKPARPQVTAMPGHYWVVNKNSSSPGALFKMLNLFVEKNFGETAEFKYMYDGEYAVYQYQDVRTFGAVKNLQHHLAIKETLETGNDENLNPEGHGYLDQVKQYQAGDPSMWRYAKIFGPDGSLKVIDQYVREDRLLYDEYYGIPSELMADRKSILADLSSEIFTKILLGESIDLFDKYVEDWNRLGGSEISQEVNEWYSSLDN